MSQAPTPIDPRRPDAPAGDRRVAELSYFFPAHDEAGNVAALIEEALGVLPSLAERFEVICVDDGSSDGTGDIAEALTRKHPGIVRVVRHASNRGYGAALRSGLAAARFPLVCFTDGDRQFRVADLARLLERLGEDPRHGPNVVVGYRIRRADPAIRLLYARLYRLSLGLFFGLWFRDPDCACKLFRKEILERLCVGSGGAFLSAELLIKMGARGARMVEVGVPHHPRTAGRASGADPRVVLRAVRDFWRLRLWLWLDREAALRGGEPLRGPREGTEQPV